MPRVDVIKLSLFVSYKTVQGGEEDQSNANDFIAASQCSPALMKQQHNNKFT